MKYILMIDLRPLADVFNHFGNIYKQNSRRIARDYELCEKYAKINRYIVIGMPIVYFVNITAYRGATLIAGIMTGGVTSSVVYFPLLDRSGIFGLVLIHIVNNVCAYVVMATLVPLEVLLYVVTANIMLFSTVITRDFDDLKMSLESSETSQRENKRKLIEIIRSVQTFIE